MSYESVKKVDQWDLENWSDIFRGLAKLRHLPEYKALLEAGNQEGEFHITINFGAETFENWAKICDIMRERMKKESERVNKANKAKQLERR